MNICSSSYLQCNAETTGDDYNMDLSKEDGITGEVSREDKLNGSCSVHRDALL